MRGRGLWCAFVAAVLMLVPTTAVLAHGEADARALVRNVTAGPYRVSLWQVDSDTATGITSHLIVMFDGDLPKMGVTLTVAATPVEVHLSTTTPNAWETTQGVTVGDQVAVAIADGVQIWRVGPVVVPPVPTPALPMKEIVLASILITARVAWWLAMRSRKVWRTSDPGRAETTATKLSEGSLAG